MTLPAPQALAQHFQPSRTQQLALTEALARRDAAFEDIHAILAEAKVALGIPDTAPTGEKIHLDYNPVTRLFFAVAERPLEKAPASPVAASPSSGGTSEPSDTSDATEEPLAVVRGGKGAKK